MGSRRISLTPSDGYCLVTIDGVERSKYIRRRLKKAGVEITKPGYLEGTRYFVFHVPYTRKLNHFKLMTLISTIPGALGSQSTTNSYSSANSNSAVN